MVCKKLFITAFSLFLFSLSCQISFAQGLCQRSFDDSNPLLYQEPWTVLDQQPGGGANWHWEEDTDDDTCMSDGHLAINPSEDVEYSYSDSYFITNPFYCDLYKNTYLQLSVFKNYQDSRAGDICEVYFISDYNNWQLIGHLSDLTPQMSNCYFAGDLELLINSPPQVVQFAIRFKNINPGAGYYKIDNLKYYIEVYGDDDADDNDDDSDDNTDSDSEDDSMDDTFDNDDSDGNEVDNSDDNDEEDEDHCGC
jgi:hypothetical protein